MACGTPVVASNTSSLPEAAGDAALLMSPTDTEAMAEALGRAITDTDLREHLIQSGLVQCQRFSWSDSARDLHMAYMDLLHGGNHV